MSYIIFYLHNKVDRSVELIISTLPLKLKCGIGHSALSALRHVSSDSSACFGFANLCPIPIRLQLYPLVWFRTFGPFVFVLILSPLLLALSAPLLISPSSKACWDDASQASPKTKCLGEYVGHLPINANILQFDFIAKNPLAHKMVMHLYVLGASMEDSSFWISLHLLTLIFSLDFLAPLPPINRPTLSTRGATVTPPSRGGSLTVVVMTICLLFILAAISVCWSTSPSTTTGSIGMRVQHLTVKGRTPHRSCMVLLDQ